MLVKPPGDARDENRRDENRRENQRERNDRAGDFVHRLERGVFGFQAVFDVAFGGFDDDNRVVNDKANREHQAEKRKRVQRKSEDGKKRERADQRDRHGEHRNQRRAPALQKNKDDDGHQNQRDDERAQDVVHALRNGERGVEGSHIIQIGGKTLLEFRHEF